MNENEIPVPDEAKLEFKVPQISSPFEFSNTDTMNVVGAIADFRKRIIDGESTPNELIEGVIAKMIDPTPPSNSDTNV